MSFHIQANVALSNLEILERRNHGLYVDYVPPARDATIAYGSIDLRFKNSLYAIWIKTFMEADKLTVSFYSTKFPARKWKYTTNVKIPLPKNLATDSLPWRT